MAIALVQKSVSIGTNGTATLPANSTAGNLLVAVIGNNVSFSVPSGWVKAIGDTTNVAWIYYYPNTVGGQSSFSFGSGGTAAFACAVYEFSGAATTSPLDATGINSAVSSPVTATTTGNVSQANEVAVQCVIDELTKPGSTTIAGDAAFTAGPNNGATSGILDHGLGAYLISPTSGSTLSARGSSSSMNVSFVGVAIATFKLAPAVTGSFNEDFQPISQPLNHNFPQVVSV